MKACANLLRPLGVFVTLAALAAGPAAAAWERQAVELGGQLGAEIAISSATSKVYIPLIQDRALAVLDGVKSYRLEMDIRATSVGYSAATGRIFVLGMFDNVVVAIDEATGVQTRIPVGSYPDNILVDDVRGKVYVSNWGGLTRQGSLSVIDSTTLAAHSVPMSGAITAMALDERTGTVVVTGEGEDFVAAVDAAGRLVAKVGAGYRSYGLAVDSRDGRVYVGSLSGSAWGGAQVNRVLTTYSLPGLRQESRIDLPVTQQYNPMVLLVDPQRPGAYFGAGDSTTLRRIDSSGSLQEWHLPLGETPTQDGRRVVNGIFALNPDPASGHVFVSSHVAGIVADFDPLTAGMEIVEVAGSQRFSVLYFLPGGRMLGVDANEGKYYVVQRGPFTQESVLARPAKLRNDLRRPISR